MPASATWRRSLRAAHQRLGAAAQRVNQPTNQTQRRPCLPPLRPPSVPVAFGRTPRRPPRPAPPAQGSQRTSHAETSQFPETRGRGTTRRGHAATSGTACVPCPARTSETSGRSREPRGARRGGGARRWFRSRREPRAAWPAVRCRARRVTATGSEEAMRRRPWSGEGVWGGVEKNKGLFLRRRGRGEGEGDGRPRRTAPHRTCPASSFLACHGGGSAHTTAGSARGFGYCLRAQRGGGRPVTSAGFGRRKTGNYHLFRYWPAPSVQLCFAGCKQPGVPTCY